MGIMHTKAERTEKVKEEKLENFEEHFEMAAGEHGKLVASNVSSGKKFEVKTPDVVIKINSDKTDILTNHASFPACIIQA
jgi:hypothetical protein